MTYNGDWREDTLRLWATSMGRVLAFTPLISAANIDGVYCPICRSWYAPAVRHPGDQCQDLSRGQETPCPGLVRCMDELEETLQPSRRG